MTRHNTIAPQDGQLRSWRFDDIRVLPDLIRYWAQARPDQTALIAGDAHRTYAQLDSASDRVADRLIANGVPHGGHVGYLGKNSIEFFELWFGANKASCALAPFNWRCSVDELVAIVGDAAPRIVFVTAEFRETIAAVRERCDEAFDIIVFDAGSEGSLAHWLGDRSGNQSRQPSVSDVALLSYTSGTTGQPKGVMATHEAFAYSFLCGALEPGMAFIDGDVMLMSMPNFHLGGSWVSIAALYHGQKLSILPAFDAAACLKAFRDDGITIAPLVPAALQMLLDHDDVGRDSFGSLRSVIYFGSPISAPLMQAAVEKMGCALSQYYGTTETWFLTILRHEHHLDDGSGRLASCGVPLPLVSIRIGDRTGGAAAIGTVGEVLVRTPMALAGYWNRPDATAEVLRDGWYHTGDLGRIDAHGHLHIVDRAKDMIISGGENIYSTEIEQALLKLSGIRMCAAVGLPDAKWGERVVGVVVRDDDASLSAETVLDHCRSLIARYKVPKQILFRDALPLTPTGKVRKAALRADLLREGAGE